MKVSRTSVRGPRKWWRSSFLRVSPQRLHVMTIFGRFTRLEHRPSISAAALVAIASADGIANSLLRQVDDGFQVVGLGKQIDQMSALHVVAGCKQGDEIACQSCRIARDVGNPRRSQFCQQTSYGLS